jgi:membrane-associated protease RseP (regulator of RpoE activity)
VDEDTARESPVVVAELVPEPAWQQVHEHRPRQRRTWLPLFLFLATCLSTWFAGTMEAHADAVRDFGPTAGLQVALLEGLKYALALMTILVCHEMGHFLQARRYGVYASYPFFLPMPIGPFGTFGAVIAMEARMGHRRALFDIGITGPLAGLVPTLIFCIVGLHLSTFTVLTAETQGTFIGAPLLFQYLMESICGPIPPGHYLALHPMAFAGWVGLFITSLNLIPIGQLDGGHVLYALLRRKAHVVATLLLMGAAFVVAWQSFHQHQPSPWLLMVFLLMLMGPIHPPTANDN